ncbi:hypothetical protein HEK616_34930 [Streptomyces nigrescens]|uniref:Lipoprotein n=2 Tax=Streptomyces TaxID=1883 RepID=A0ABM7ZUH7_STRNI|nr:hypothetical protein [Streptomyces nigrescens]MEE4422413.1 hypothetical protein [Streptomyces sp. DSM 41528]BDM70006.1 hypothetical protein HEK616_34930 [Streptomyces nigrescens]
MKAKRTLTFGALLLSVVAGCGIRPTGVIDAGEPVTGLTKGMRIYFASDTGLRGVSRPDLKLHSLDAVIKLLVAGPNASEQKSGLTNLVAFDGSYHVSGDAHRVTLDAQDTYLSPDARLRNGQLVCSLARAQAALHPKLRPDDIQVTLRARGDSLGPYACSYFLRN